MSESVLTSVQTHPSVSSKPVIPVADADANSSPASPPVSQSPMASGSAATVTESSSTAAKPVPAASETPRMPSINAGKISPAEVGKGFQTRLPNVTLPGPASGVEFTLDGLGVPLDSILEETKDFDVARVVIASGKATIFPKADGDHEIVVPIQAKDGQTFITTFLLTVNPDPKSLWKDIPVPEGTPFVKSNQDVFHFDDGSVRIIAASQRGRSHAQQGTCRDDDMAFWSDSATGRYVLVVADGAGSAKFSRQGSKIVVETAVRELSEKLTDAVWASEGGDFNPDGNVCKVLVAAARTAVGAIDAFVKEKKSDAGFGNPDLALRDFNTTLLMAAVKRLPDGGLRGATFSIGDGAITWCHPGAARLLCAPDGGEFSGQTKFLTTLSVWKDAYDAIQKARCFTFQKTPEEARSGILFLMSDGVSDPFFETDNLLRNPAEWDKFRMEQLDSLSLFGESGEQAAEAASKRLLDWLSFWSVGNHDDRTIVVFGAAPVPPSAVPPPPQEREETPGDTQETPYGFFEKLFGRKS